MCAPAILTQCNITIIGLMMIAYHSNDYVRYTGMFLGTAGAQGNIPTVLAYQSKTLECSQRERLEVPSKLVLEL